jgi:hypothetical protein
MGAAQLSGKALGSAIIRVVTIRVVLEHAATRHKISVRGVRIIGMTHHHPSAPRVWELCYTCVRGTMPRASWAATGAAYERESDQRHGSRLRKEGSMLLLLLISLPFFTSGLIWYGAAATFAADRADARTVILTQGLVFGLLLGTFLFVMALLGNVIPVPPLLMAVIDTPAVLFVGGVALGTLGGAGFRVAQDIGRVRAGALAGVLAGVVGFMLGGLAFVVIDSLFFDLVSQQPEKIWNFTHSGYHDMRAFLFDSTVQGGLMVTLAGAGAGAVCGTLGGLLGARRAARKASI